MAAVGDSRFVPPSAARAETPAAPGVRLASWHRRLSRIFVRSGRAFVDDNVSRLGAALAFYTTTAIAPLLLLAVAAAGMVFHGEAARREIITEVALLAGRQAGQALEAVQSPNAPTSTSVIGTIIGVLTLGFGAFGVFYHLQDALNSIWRVQIPASVGWRAFLKRRVFSFATVLATGFLLLVSLIASAVLSWLGGTLVARLGLPPVALQLANNALSLIVITFLFAMTFKLLPDTHVPWRHVWLGAIVTAFLFTIGKALLGAYLGRTNVTSAYGAAGSLIVLLLWCYYAGQIVFLGAEFTRVATLTHGGRDFSAFKDPLQKQRSV
jgi:membrane protein